MSDEGGRGHTFWERGGSSPPFISRTTPTACPPPALEKVCAKQKCGQHVHRHIQGSEKSFSQEQSSLYGGTAQHSLAGSSPSPSPPPHRQCFTEPTSAHTVAHPTLPPRRRPPPRRTPSWPAGARLPASHAPAERPPASARLCAVPRGQLARVRPCVSKTQLDASASLVRPFAAAPPPPWRASQRGEMGVPLSRPRFARSLARACVRACGLACNERAGRVCESVLSLAL